MQGLGGLSGASPLAPVGSDGMKGRVWWQGITNLYTTWVIGMGEMPGG